MPIIIRIVEPKKVKNIGALKDNSCVFLFFLSPSLYFSISAVAKPTLLILFPSRIPPDYAVVIYAVGVQQGGEKEWNHLWLKSQSTKVASEAEIMMNALAYTQEPWLLWR